MTDLDQALAMFAKTRSSELTHAIVVLGTEAIADLTPPTFKKNLDFHHAWLELATDPSKRSWCLATLLDKLPKLLDGKEHPSGDKDRALEQRLKVLRGVPPDPRIAHALLAAIELRPPVLGFVYISEELARVLVAHADDTTRDAPALAEIRRESMEILTEGPWPNKVALDASEIVTVSTKRTAPRDLETLYAAVYAEPAADEPREVLADALQEANDPRGEFIALQLREARGDSSDELRNRAQALVQLHGKQWLGPLRAITYRAEMRRGFLAKLELAGSWASAKWQQLADEPMLATIEELARGQATGKTYATFLAGVMTKTVRSIDVFDDAIWKIVAAMPMPRLDRLVVVGWTRKDYKKQFAAVVAPWLETQPDITRLAVQSEKLLGTKTAARLTHLEISGSIADGAKVWTAMPALRELTLGLFYDPLALIREGEREHARLLSTRLGSPVPDLRSLPPAIKRIEIVNNATQAKELAKAFPELEIIATKPPSGLITGVK